MTVTFSAHWLWAIPFIVGLLLLWAGNREQKRRRRLYDGGTFGFMVDMVPTGSGVMGCFIIFATIFVLIGVLVSNWIR